MPPCLQICAAQSFLLFAPDALENSACHKPVAQIFKGTAIDSLSLQGEDRGEDEELDEQIFFRIEAVGGGDGGVGVLQRLRARQFTVEIEMFKHYLSPIHLLALQARSDDVESDRAFGPSFIPFGANETGGLLANNTITSLRKNLTRALPALWRNRHWIVRITVGIKPGGNTRPNHHALHPGDTDRRDRGHLDPAGSIGLGGDEGLGVLTTDGEQEDQA